MGHISIFASGNGTNAIKIIEHLPDFRFSVYVNKKEAGVIEKVKKYGVEAQVFNRKELEHGRILKSLKDKKTDLIVLAGFLWLIPKSIIQCFPSKIINIHPSLLPKYGGKGMHGAKVHAAVLENKEKESGITIHYVNEFYDEGAYILQQKCSVRESDDVSSLAKRVQALEHLHYPKVVEKLLKGE